MWTESAEAIIFTGHGVQGELPGRRPLKDYVGTPEYTRAELPFVVSIAIAFASK